MEFEFLIDRALVNNFYFEEGLEPALVDT